MKQGRADVSNVTSVKREPIPHAVSESAVAQIGLAQPSPGPALYEGRGFKAPMAGSDTHPSGSQGKHK